MVLVVHEQKDDVGEKPDHKAMRYRFHNFPDEHRPPADAGAISFDGIDPQQLLARRLASRQDYQPPNDVADDQCQKEQNAVQYAREQPAYRAGSFYDAPLN